MDRRAFIGSLIALPAGFPKLCEAAYNTYEANKNILTAAKAMKIMQDLYHKSMDRLWWTGTTNVNIPVSQGFYKQLFDGAEENTEDSST